MAGELGVGLEAVDRADLGEQLRGGDRAAAGQLEQRRRDLLRSAVRAPGRARRSSRLSERQRATSSRASRTCSSCSRRASQRPTRSRCDGRSSIRSGTTKVGSSWCRCQRSRCWIRRRSSTRSSRWSTSSFRSRGRRCSSGARPAQVRLAQRRPGDRERVDRVRLARAPGRRAAPAPSASAAPAPAPRRARAAAAPASGVSCRQSSSAHSRSPPSAAAQPSSSSLPTGDRPLVEHPAGLVDGDRGHRLLVYVHSDHDHLARLQCRWGRPASGQTSIEAKATLLSGHARRSRSAAATQRWTGQPYGRHSESSQPPPTESAPATGRHHPPRMTLSSAMHLPGQPEISPFRTQYGPCAEAPLLSLPKPRASSSETNTPKSSGHEETPFTRAFATAP